MFTVLGAKGFIGSHLARWLAARAMTYRAPARDEDLRGQSLGHVIYCIGLTADFRERPFDTVRAHVSRLLEILETTEFDSLLYLSTTRVYAGLKGLAEEDAALSVNPARADDLYNISKIMGESLSLAARRAKVRVVRLSNVYGRDFSSSNFLASVIKEAVGTGRVRLRTSLDSAKDYVHVGDVVQLLPRIALKGRSEIYNLASGVNTTNAELMRVIQDVTKCEVEVATDAPRIVFPPVSIARIKEEFDFAPSTVQASLAELIGDYQQQAATKK
jgi:nucleoside-diphosphate-sugar epimerase